MIQYWRLDTRADGACNWIAADAKTFHAGDNWAVPTSIFVHGNRVQASGAIEEAWPIYQRLKQYACSQPFRFVIWSWPSERVYRRRPRTDVQIKVCYSHAEPYYLGHFLSEVRPGTRVGLIGYSLGAAAITGALELLGGGQVAGHALPPDAMGRWAAGERRSVRVMLVAAAIDAGALMPDRAYGHALDQVERILVTENRSERALRYWPRLYGRGGPPALGRVGPWCWRPSDSGCEKIEVADVTYSVGRSHAWRKYQVAPQFVARLAWYAYLAP